MRIKMFLKKTFKWIWNEFIYGGHLQSLGSLSLVFVSGILLKIQITFDVLAITYLICYPPYLYNRLKEIDKDYLTNPERTKHLRKHLKFISIIFYFSLFLLVVALVYFGNLNAIIFGLILVVLGFFYTIFFKKITNKIPCFKNIYVSLFFASLPFFLVVYSSSVISLNLYLFSLFIFIESFLMQIFLDIKDIASDKKENLRTFPVIFGFEKTLLFLYLFNFISVVVIMGFFFYLNIFPKSILMLFLTIPFDFYCYMLLKKQEYFAYIMQGSKFVLWPFLIILGEIIL